jgi:hypothetical protein
MPLIKNLLAGVILAALALGAGCARDPVAGNSSQTGNGVVVGQLVHAATHVPAAKVPVTMRPRATLADISGSPTTIDSFTTLTDAHGQFAFDDAVDTGLYVIEAASGDTEFAFIDSVHVADLTATLDVADTLRPAGAIKGMVLLGEGGDPRKVLVVAFGLNRSARVDSNGGFRFEQLAQGAFDVRLLSLLDTYGVIDTPGVAVTAGDTTDLGTLALPFLGIPTPKSLTSQLDTATRSVLLQWAGLDPARVTGYRVYRKTNDSDYVKISATLVTDTRFVDTDLRANTTYEYRIQAVDQTNAESAYSTAVAVTTATFTKLRRRMLLDLSGTPIQDLRIGNVNNDEALDLLVTINDQANGPRLVWYEQFAGNFSEHVAMTAGSSYRAAYLPAAGFIDPENGSRDLLVVLEDMTYGYWLQWLKNDGGNHFTPYAIDSLPGFCAGLYQAPLHDPLPNTIVAETNAANGFLWYTYVNDSTFSRHSLPGGRAGLGSCLADFDRDGDQDIFRMYYYDQSAYWYQNMGDTVFTEHLVDNRMPSPKKSYALDYDQDGDSYILALSAELGLVLYKNNGSAQFAETLLVADTIAECVLADISGDGQADLAVNRTIDGAMTVGWYERDGAALRWRQLPTESGEQLIDAVDIDGDGDIDIVTRQVMTNTFFLYVNE